MNGFNSRIYRAVDCLSELESSQSEGLVPSASACPGSLLQMQNPGSHSRPTNQKQNFNKSLGNL